MVRLKFLINKNSTIETIEYIVESGTIKSVINKIQNGFIVECFIKTPKDKTWIKLEEKSLIKNLSYAKKISKQLLIKQGLKVYDETRKRKR
jgi:histone acetyltransferase (RNA polymerase elongator complex component)